MTFCDFLSIKDYWYATVSAGLGCWGGITWANWQQARTIRKKDREAKSALVKAIGGMRNLADQAATSYNSGGQPSFPIESQRAASLVARIATFANPNLRGQVEGLVYECDHYNAKLGPINSAFVIATTGGGSAAALAPHRTMMMTAAKDIMRWCDEALSELQKEELK